MDIITKTGEIWSENVIGAVISLIKVSFQNKFHSAMLLGIYSGKLSTLEFTIKILLIKNLSRALLLTITSKINISLWKAA